MRRKRRRLLDLIMRVTVYDPLTVLLENGCRSHRIETRCCNWTSRDTEEKRVAVDAPPYQSHKFNGACGLSWRFRRGAYESSRGAGVSLLFSSRWYRQGHSRRVCCPPLPLSGRCRDGKKTVSDTSVSLFSTCLPSHLEGVKQHLSGRRWMLCTNGLMDYSCLFLHVACRY